MIKIRKRDERGHFDHGWLDTWHTFSFADYHDSAHMGFRTLRVMNEDTVAAGRGFGTHSHRDMEILTFVLSGALEDKDSTGGGSVIRPGEVQRMSAGSGIQHSEINPSPVEATHLYQVWLLPEERGIAPGYEQKLFPPAERDERLCLVAARDARDGALKIHQDASVYLGNLRAATVTHELKPGRHAWLQVLSGAVQLRSTAAPSGIRLEAGDGAAASEEAILSITPESAAQVLLFDLG